MGSWRSPETSESIISSEVSNRHLRRALISDVRFLLHSEYPRVSALVFEDPERLEVVLLFGQDSEEVPALPASRVSVLARIGSENRPEWWPALVQLWRMLGSPSHLQL